MSREWLEFTDPAMCDDPALAAWLEETNRRLSTEMNRAMENMLIFGTATLPDPR